MENDKFQEVVLEHLATLTKEITGLKTDISEFKQKTDSNFNRVDERFKSIDERFNRVDEKFICIDERFNRIEKKLDTTIAQTAELTEFRNESTQMMGRIIDSFDFLKSRQFNTEEELFRLKKRIS